MVETTAKTRVRAQTKIRVGRVVSNKMDKTVVVLIERLVKHPIYQKYLRKSTKVKVHDAQNVCQIGDTVRIKETKPLSKEKRWRVVEVI